MEGVLSWPTCGICHKNTILEIIEIRYHESSWKKITCGYNKQGKLKSLTLKNNMEEVLQIQKNSYHMIQQLHSWAYI